MDLPKPDAAAMTWPLERHPLAWQSAAGFTSEHLPL
jgi:hypothetical protein